jgi:hypothetical protein
MPSVLFVFTSANKNLSGAQTVRIPDTLLILIFTMVAMQGWYLPEAAHPYYVLSPHVAIDFASPAGPNPPVDENSVKASVS